MQEWVGWTNTFVILVVLTDRTGVTRNLLRFPRGILGQTEHQVGERVCCESVKGSGPPASTICLCVDQSPKIAKEVEEQEDEERRERSGFRVQNPEIEEKGNGGRTSIEFDPCGRPRKSKESKDTTSMTGTCVLKPCCVET